MTDEPRILSAESLIEGLTGNPKTGGPTVIDGEIEALQERVQAEAEKIIFDQLAEMGVEITKETIQNHCKRVLYPEDPNHFCEYRYDGILLLQIRWNASGLGLDFLIPPIGDPKGGRT